MKYFYSSASMGFYGEGYWWHVFFNFPNFSLVSKTITLNPIKGTPWRIIRIPFLKTTWNKIGLHNKGFWNWCRKYKELSREARDRIIPSISGTDFELQYMIDMFWILGNEFKDYFNFKMVELNLSCPNIIKKENKVLPKSPYPLSLKLRWDMNPYDYDLSRVKRVTLNSVPSNIALPIFTKTGAISGKLAQKYNWKFIMKYLNDLKEMNIKVTGCSITCQEDIDYLQIRGVEEIGLGSIMLINPWLVTRLKNEDIQN